jgi:hypothetical protein
MATTANCARAVLLYALLSVAAPSAAAGQSDLEKARAMYNGGRFEESIAAAAAAKHKPDSVPSATLIEARARLERFRQNGDAADLGAARAALVSLNPRVLAPQEIIEWQIGIGTALFLENQPGPAAEMFATVLPAARERLSPAELEKLVEWWASTVARVAESQTGAARKDAYTAMLSAVRQELERNPLSWPASYWLVVAARGAGNLDDAWNAAITAWIRVGSQPEGVQVRGDLERFVTQTLIPERAQARTGQRLDSKTTESEIAAQTEQWRALVEHWRPQT